MTRKNKIPSKMKKNPSHKITKKRRIFFYEKNTFLIKIILIHHNTIKKITLSKKDKTEINFLFSLLVFLFFLFTYFFELEFD
jgi:hypothetical protein